MLKVFREGGSSELNIPLLPSKSVNLEGLDEAKEIYFQKRYRNNQEEAEKLSLWTELLHKLSLANYVGLDAHT